MCWWTHLGIDWWAPMCIPWLFTHHPSTLVSKVPLQTWASTWFMHNEDSPHFWIAVRNFRIKNIRKCGLDMAGQLHSPQDHPTSTSYICNYWAILRSNMCVCARYSSWYSGTTTGKRPMQINRQGLEICVCAKSLTRRAARCAET
jgi:hypothetical protein